MALVALLTIHVSHVHPSLGALNFAQGSMVPAVAGPAEFVSFSNALALELFDGSVAAGVPKVKPPAAGGVPLEAAPGLGVSQETHSVALVALLTIHVPHVHPSLGALNFAQGSGAPGVAGPAESVSFSPASALVLFGVSVAARAPKVKPPAAG